MPPLLWHARDRVFEIGHRPFVMGIVNVTPDSFSDGGRYQEVARAVDHGLKLVADGADVLDVGGESTRPGAAVVSTGEELRRVVPVVAALAARTTVPISVDTMKPEVARQCLAAGATIVNDVGGFADPEMRAVAANHRAGVVVMHMQGTPATMQDDPRYLDVVREVGAFFEDRLHSLAVAGIPAEYVCLDPGIGFGKKLEHNLDLLANLGAFRRFGRPLCLGVSRKGLVGTVCGRGLADRMPGSLAVACFAVARGEAHVLRVHDVGPTRDAALLADAIGRHRH